MLDLITAAPLSRPALPAATEPVPCSGLRVLKFGGSSLATPARVRDCGRIVVASAAGGPAVVVVSAFQDVTDRLIECARQAERGDTAAAASYEAVADRHRDAAATLIDSGDRVPRAHVDRLLRELRGILRGIRLLGCCPPAALDGVASFGERLSACIVAGHLNEFLQARFVDARDFLTTDDQFTRASVHVAATNHACREHFAALWREAPSAVPVVTGFIGRSDGGRTTTIGRNGSDYTAAIVGAALGATAIEIWTDVDGVLSADPKTVPGTFVMPGITYDDALEMSHAGAKVLHPGTIGPAVARSIPIVVKNTFNPDGQGTRISATPAVDPQPAGGVVSMNGLTLLTLRMGGRPAGRSIAERLSHALAARAIDVVVGSHAWSALSTSFAVRQADAAAARDAVQKEFCFELERGFASLTETSGQALITVVGAAAGEPPGIPAGVFGALARHALTVNAFAQGTSARSVSCLIDAAQESRARRVIHADLFERTRSLAIAVLGVGQVGGALLRELGERQPSWRERGVDIKVVAVADSTRYLLDPRGLDLRAWRDALRRSDRPADPHGLAAALAALDLPSVALVDCTAGTAVVDAYGAFVDARCHIVTPNKRAGVLPWLRYAALRETLAAHRLRFLDSTTVGAGLPLLASVRRLIDGGDEIRKIEGLLSGTLGYLFSSFDGRTPFSALVREAHAAGLTEPDPREDLSGHDVARKLLILAREAGHRIELEDVEVDSLLPPGMSSSSCHTDIFAALEAADAGIQRRFELARARGAVLRYVATLERGRAHAGVREIPRDHPLAASRGCENVVAFTSERYASSPLVIQGPGAGATLTARAIVADICSLVPERPS